MTTTKDLYEILNIPKNASNSTIKKAYHKLALKYHPDKSSKIDNIYSISTDTQFGEVKHIDDDRSKTEIFQDIVMSYQILSNPIKRNQYDNLNKTQKKDIFQTIKSILSKIFEESFKDNNIKLFIESGNFNQIKYYIFNKIYEKLINNDDNTVDDIFISVLEANCSSYETSSSICSSDMNMQISIDTNLEEIYYNKIKELTILRHNIDHTIENKKIYIPLYDDKLIYYKEGDQFINKNNIIDRGDISIKIKCKKHKYLKRVNEYDLLLLLPITEEELEKTCKKKIRYFDQTITLKLFKNSDLEFKFPNLGLPSQNNRGTLIIKFIII
jgi:DnaJ-class molecular chaperone